MGIVKSLCAAVLTQTVIFSSFLQPSCLSTAELEDGLLYELKPLAQTFMEIEEEYDINAALYASVVALESGWGRSSLSQSKNNITSFTCSDGFKSYESKEECLWDMARNLSENYLDEDGAYYNGSDRLDDVACYYLLGKPKEQMNDAELEQLQYYIETVQEIKNGIVKRSINWDFVCAS